jgi:hypothetical protein
MPNYQFVLKETPQGQANHDTHLQRRALAVAKANVLGANLAQPVVETQIGGEWYYTWVLDAPDIQTVFALIQEFTKWGFVVLASGPTPVFTGAELSQIQNLSGKLRGAFPNE